MARRGGRSSPAPASLPDNEDMLFEILLRLPPVPSSLPRASLVCKQWRRLITDPSFLHRFRARHRHNAPLLGFFADGVSGLSFTPTLEPPNCVPQGCFSLPLDNPNDDCWKWCILSCRNGLVLLRHWQQLQILVWNPVTADQYHIAVPQGFDTREKAVVFNGAVLRAVGDVHGGSQSSPFQVVLVGSDQGCTRAFVCVYSSETGVWHDSISISCPEMYAIRTPGTLVGGSLYWSLSGSSVVILEFDLGRQRLAVIDIPYQGGDDVWVVPGDGGVLGFLDMSDDRVRLWRRETDCNGLAGWVLGRTIELDNLLSLSSDDKYYPWIFGFAEDDNVLLIGVGEGHNDVFTIQLESMKVKQFKIRFASLDAQICHPFSVVYTAGMGKSLYQTIPATKRMRRLDGEYEGAELLHK